MVKPQNRSEAVDHFLSVMGYSPHQLVTMEQNDPGTRNALSQTHLILSLDSSIFPAISLLLSPLADTPLPVSLPNPCSMSHIATHYLGIQSVPRRSFFEYLSKFTENELEREKLEEFCTAEGQVNIDKKGVACGRVYSGPVLVGRAVLVL